MKDALKKILIFILEAEAKLVLKKYKPRIIAITGSVGKTSTKDAVYAVLSKFYYVRKSEKSFNSEIGLPLTILGCPNAWSNLWPWVKNIIYGLELILMKHEYPEWLVLEIGADKPGDIKRVSRWLYADAVVITRIGKTPVHIEFYNSLAQLVEEKASLLKSAKTDGLVILNADDEVVADLKNKTKNRVMTYGFNEEADMQASNMQVLYKKNDNPPAGGEETPDGILFRINYDGNSLPVAIEGAFGQNHVYSALVGLSVANGLSLNMVTAAEALKSYETPPGRNKLIEGVKNTLIIDDTYNSSPVAAEAAVKTLDELKIKKRARKIAVLGDMLELGRHTDEMHKELGKIASKVADILVTVGPRARLIAEGALNYEFPENKIFQYDDSRSAGKFVEGIIKDGDIILVKGSQGVRMERAVEEIMAHPENKESLLVRQDPEWSRR